MDGFITIMNRTPSRQNIKFRSKRSIAVRCLAVAFVAAATVPSKSRAQAQQGLLPPMRYAPPEATFSGQNQLQLLQGEIDQKHLDAAATRLETLLRDSSDALMGQGEDGSVLSVGTWVQNLPADTKSQLRAAFESADGPAAEQAVEEAQAKPDADPADFYSLSACSCIAGGAGRRRSAQRAPWRCADGALDVERSSFGRLDG
jgi:hypothetical protein